MILGMIGVDTRKNSLSRTTYVAAAASSSSSSPSSPLRSLLMTRCTAMMVELEAVDRCFFLQASSFYLLLLHHSPLLDVSPRQGSKEHSDTDGLFRNDNHHSFFSLMMMTTTTMIELGSERRTKQDSRQNKRARWSQRLLRIEPSRVLSRLKSPQRKFSFLFFFFFFSVVN